jgi:GxxExxY protein
MDDLNQVLDQITGVAQELHAKLGPFHEELVYNRLLLSRLRHTGFEVEDHPCIKLLDDDGELVKVYLPDLRVRSQDSQALLELKAKPRGFQELDYRQAQAYLSVSPEDVLVVLLNFGSESLGQDRIYQRSIRKDE